MITRFRIVASCSVAFLFILTALVQPAAQASDHDDTPLLRDVLQRHDARITDLYAFREKESLVLVLCTNPAIPPAVTSYQFPPDLTLRFMIDNRQPVRFNDEAERLTYGGTLIRPAVISEKFVFEVSFDAEGEPRLEAQGLPERSLSEIKVFAGLRDDPFIRKPRRGRNVAAVVLEVPLYLLRMGSPTLVIWATSHIPGVGGTIADHGGRALRSQFLPNMDMNSMAPSNHMMLMQRVPDVIIYNLILDVVFGQTFPNGRALDDDVVELVTDIPINGGVLPGEGPDYPSENDVPFLDEFPYLAEPHQP